MLGKCRFSIVVLEVSYVFLKPGFEGSTCLARVRHLTVGAGQLVHATFPVFAFGVVRPADLGILRKLVVCATHLRRIVFRSLLGEVRIFFKFSVYIAEKSPLLLLDC